MEVSVKDSDGNPIFPAKITDNGDGTYNVDFVPKVPGEYSALLDITGVPIPLVIPVSPVEPSVSFAEKQLPKAQEQSVSKLAPKVAGKAEVVPTKPGVTKSGIPENVYAGKESSLPICRMCCS